MKKRSSIKVARWRLTRVALVLGILFGGGTGVAYAKYEHYSGGWTHGIDSKHVYMTVQSGSHEGVVAWVDANRCLQMGEHSGEVRYTASHVHMDGNPGWCQVNWGGHFSSPSAYGLSHHEHLD